jgi:2-polyprenyl-6-methoxyphenol hydroxylase-like FAD-dependent oxidoreductase
MTKVIVAGGGVGGLTTAIALRRAGLEVDLYEQAADLQQIGAGLHLWTNAVKVLQGLGVAEKVAENSCEMRKAEFRTARGGLIASWPIPEISRDYGAPTLMISREALSGVLASFVDDSAIHLGMKVTGFEESGDGVEVRFADGSSAQADVLVGADGLRSAVRAQVLGDQRPREAGYTVWRGVVPGARGMIEPGLFNSVFGRGERFVFYEVGFDELYWMSVAANEGADETRGEALKAVLHRRHEGWFEPIQKMMAATPPEAIHRTVIYDRPPDERWSSQRATLLGDAAHPMTFNVGQGACQAIEDAVVLARHLSGNAAVPAALQAYESERKPRTAKFQNLATRLGNMGQLSNPVAVQVRNNMMRVIYRTVALKEHRKDMAFTA